MKTYDVTILETMRKTITVPADSREEAERKAEDMVGCGMIMLDPITDHYETYCEGMLSYPDED